MFRGDRLKELRDEKEITQADLGKLINVKEAIVAKYERRNKEPDSEKLDFLANYFKVSADYLLGRTNDKSLFIKANLDLIRGEMSYKELSADIANKLKERFSLKSFDAESLKDIFEGRAMPKVSTLLILANYAQVHRDFFNRNNTSINDLIAAQEKYKNVIENSSKPRDPLTHVDDDLYSFIANKDNLKYLEFAKKLEEKGINPDDIIS
jgi:transcriptional regulator with XRE-family HTH domain